MGRPLLAIAATLLLLAPAPAEASEGEWFYDLSAGYSAMSVQGPWLHLPTFRAGLGYFPSDFSVAVLQGVVSGTAKEGEYLQQVGLRGEYRLLIDAFEWVPSVGPVAGIMGSYDAGEGLDAFAFLGLTACVDYRPTRDEAFGLCGDVTIVPGHTYYQSMWAIMFNYSGFLLDW